MKSSLSALSVAIFLSLFAMLAAPSGARAQCSTINYINMTSFNVRIQLWGTAVIDPVDVPAGGSVSAAPFAPAHVDGVFSFGGNYYQWSATGCVNGVMLQTTPPPAQCYNVCWNAATCTATITFAGPLPCSHP